MLGEVTAQLYHGTWSFQIGTTELTYEGSFILTKEEDEVRKLKHGKGVMKWQDGRKYEGEFSLDKMHGEGAMSWPTGAKYTGQYCNNRKGGIGTLTLPDGSSFEGNWCRESRHGDFLYIDPNGHAFLLEYDSDKVVRTESIPSPHGWTLQPGYDVFTACQGTDMQVEDKEGECSPCSEPMFCLDMCCICLDKISDGDTCCRTPCKHVFHKECIDMWARKKNQCPLCLQRIPAHKLRCAV